MSPGMAGAAMIGCLIRELYDRKDPLLGPKAEIIARLFWGPEPSEEQLRRCWGVIETEASNAG